MQVVLQDRKNLIILSVRDVASPHLFQYYSICIAAIYNMSAFIANEQKMLSLFIALFFFSIAAFKAEIYDISAFVANEQKCYIFSCK
jgi:hypothetical protein